MLSSEFRLCYDSRLTISGATRNSLAVNYIDLFYGNNESLINERTTDCMWLIAARCQSWDFNGTINNECGVPHSSLAPADNLGIFVEVDIN